MPKPGEFVHYKTKTSFRIAWNRLVDFSDNFCGDIPVRVDSASQHEFFLSVTTIEIL